MGPVESLEDCLFVGLMVSILQLVVPKVGPEAHPGRARFTLPAAPKISLGGTPYVHLAVIVSTTPTSNLMPSPYGVLVSPDGSIGPNFKPRPHLTHSQKRFAVPPDVPVRTPRRLGTFMRNVILP